MNILMLALLLTTGTQPQPQFEVASVKRSRSSENTAFHFTPGMVVIRDLPVAFIIEVAYARDMGPYGFSLLRDNQLLGGPGWMHSGYDGYDIVAKVPDSLASHFGKDRGHAFFHGRCGYRKQIFLMLRSLLADRFKLRVKSETEEGPVFDLVTTEDGPKFLHTTFPLAGSSAEAQEESLPPLHPLPCPTRIVLHSILRVNGGIGGLALTAGYSRTAGNRQNGP